MDDKKKIAAAIAGVLEYLNIEEEAGAPPHTVKPVANAVSRINLWGLSGRQTQMNMRTMVSLKAFHGRRPG